LASVGSSIWKDPHRAEVDFVIHERQRVKTLIQVASDLRDPRVRSRENRGLIKAALELRGDDLLLLGPDAWLRIRRR
jgi:predicted AAA+ superfamily ATPase